MKISIMLMYDINLFVCFWLWIKIIIPVLKGDAGEVIVRVYPDADDNTKHKDVWGRIGTEGKDWKMEEVVIGRRPANFKVALFDLKNLSISICRNY